MIGRPDPRLSRRCAACAGAVAGAALFIVAALPPAPAAAASLFVRTDGDDANPGTGSSPAEAFRTVGRCLEVAQAGDRCLIGPGVYWETGLVQPRGGALVGQALANCACTRGERAVACDGEVPAEVAPGTFVRCAGAPGFAWSRVESVDGATIVLAEPYRGASLAGAPLDVARFVEIIGQGRGPRDVVISEFRSQPSRVRWESDPLRACVWRYQKSSAGDPTWLLANGFRENAPDGEWNLATSQKNGRDLYYRLWGNGSGPAGGDCPCQAGTVADQVFTVPGSWGDDGTFVYLQPRACIDPERARVEAARHGNGGVGGATLQSQQDFTVVENLSVETGGSDTATESSPAFGLVLGASHARYSRLRQEGGRLVFGPPAGSVDTLFEHVRALSGAECALSTGHSGLRLYDVEIRGGAPSGLRCGAVSGAGAGDPVVFERLWVHRSFPPLAGVDACGREPTWDCDNHEPAPCMECEDRDRVLRAGQGPTIGDPVSDNATDHLVIRNSVVELVGDGWGIFQGSLATDVWLVNNTFGLSYRAGYGLKALLGTAGASEPWGARLYNNLFVLGASTKGGISRRGALGQLESDYNLYLAFRADGAVQVWDTGETLEHVIATTGQEAHSAVVCRSGCSGAQGTYFNDDGESGLVRATLDLGVAPDYSPTAGYRGRDLGTNDWCPEEDFLGLRRGDGRCDIGAIEWQAIPAGPDAGVPDGSGPEPHDASEPVPEDASTPSGEGDGSAATPRRDGGSSGPPADAGTTALPGGCGCGAGSGGGLGLAGLLVTALLLSGTGTRRRRGQ